MLRSALANVMSALALISIWLASGRWASIGSSTVITLCVKRSIWFSIEYRVVVLPLPVGPQTSTMPDGLAMALGDDGPLALGNPGVGQGEPAGVLVEHANRQFLAVQRPGAGHAEGDAVSPLRAVKAPSCGRRRSEMSMLETALTLLITARHVSAESSRTARNVPSMRSRIV